MVKRKTSHRKTTKRKIKKKITNRQARRNPGFREDIEFIDFRIDEYFDRFIVNISKLFNKLFDQSFPKIIVKKADLFFNKNGILLKYIVNSEEWTKDDMKEFIKENVKNNTVSDFKIKIYETTDSHGNMLRNNYTYTLEMLLIPKINLKNIEEFYF